MDNINVIIKPLVTEKSTHQQATRNAYAFQVHTGANKHQIKDAVEKLYEVKVKDVRTMTRKGKPRRSRNKMATTSDWKFRVAKRRIVGCDERDLPTAEMHTLAALGIRRREGQREPRMPRDERTELAAGVTTGAKDADRNPIHTRCIIMHKGRRNAAPSTMSPTVVLWANPES